MAFWSTILWAPSVTAPDQQSVGVVSEFDQYFSDAEAMFSEVFGVSVVYLAGAIQIPWTAEVTLQKHDTLGDHGVMTTVTSRDYSGLAGVLAAAGITEPEPGHRIVETIAGVAHTFEVMPIANGPCWAWADESHRQIIARTKEVS